MKTIVAYLLAGCLATGFWSGAFAQSNMGNGQDTVSYGHLPQVPLDLDSGGGVLPPATVEASDGDYDQYVKITWSALAAGTFYKVWRSESENMAKPIEVSNGWKKSNWMADHYQVVPGKKYFYGVVAAIDDRHVSGMSRQDMGFARLTKPVAGQVPDSSSIPSPPLPDGMPDSFALRIAHFNNTHTLPGDTMVISYLLAGLPSGDSIMVRIFLSKDAVLDWDDTPILLGNNLGISPQPGQFCRQNVRVAVPKEAEPGEYFLLLVGARKGEVLQSRVHALPLRLSRR